MVDFFRNLNREQLQKLSAAIGLGVALLVGIHYFVIAPALRDARALATQTEETQQTLEHNQRLLQDAEQVEERHRQVQNRFAFIIDQKLAPSGNELSWVSSAVQSVAQTHGISVENLSGQGISRPTPAGRDAPPPRFEVYEANLTLACGYHDFGRFLAQFESRLPYARLESVTMRPGRAATDRERRLSVNLRYAFPRFTDEGFPVDQRPRADQVPDPDDELTAQDMTERDDI